MSELVCRTLELLAEAKDGFLPAIKNIFNTKTMATLNISDLSVGDWVKCDQRNGRIQRIGMNEGEGLEVMIEAACGQLYMYKRVYEIDPILITAEILEKNGLFRHKLDNDNPECIVLSNHFIMARTYSDVDWWRILIYDEEIPSEELFSGIVHSIHQLQHALRLAGAEKEINL